MKRTLTLMAAALLLLAACGQNAESSPRKVEDFNFGWKFILGDNPQYAFKDYEDSLWRPLHLPHDWSIEGEFSKDNPSTASGGALPGGIGWYRKAFEYPEIGKDIDGNPLKRVYIEFDGVFMNSTVFINGHNLGTRPYGYSSFRYELTPYLKAGGKNVIAVRCDNSDQPNSRWYAGCGIYRDVRLVTTSDLAVDYNGTFVTTPEISAESCSVQLEARLLSRLDKDNVELRTSILSPSGRKLVREKSRLSLSAGENTVSRSLSLRNPKLWGPGHPELYTLRVELYSDGELKDCYDTRFGVRSISWDADKGFFLNGENLKLLGVCLHHDMGCIGTAVHKRALERELGMLMDMGVNAIRTSHNPPSPVLLELCDEMGLLVMDEAMDMWRKRKTRYDYARFFDEWHVRDVQDFIIRDRNHPSVVMWSVGNEIIEQSDTRDDMIENLSAEEANLLLNFIHSLGGNDGSENNPNVLLTKHMVDLVKQLDTTRAVTAGCNGVWPGNNLLRSGALDVYGFNYHPQLYDSCRVWFPGKPLIGSETASALNSRGVYLQPSTKKQLLPGNVYGVHNPENWGEGQPESHQCTAYDVCSAPWANTHEDAWVAVRDRDFIAGTFLWTGFDYLGEPTPYDWPSRSSYFGVFDLAGFPKDAYWMYKSEWTDETTLHLFPHWNWEPGRKIDIWAYYNNADEVELFVNGKSMGRKSKTDDVLHVQWNEVPFEAGKIEAVSYRDGNEIARDARYTTGEPVTLKLTADRKTIDADGYDLCYVTVEAVDAGGLEVPTACDMLEFSVEGCGELYGVDNGNAADTLSLKGSRKALFNGKALAVIRSKKGEKGTVTLSVKSDYASVKLNIKTK